MTWISVSVFQFHLLLNCQFSLDSKQSNENVNRKKIVKYVRLKSATKLKLGKESENQYSSQLYSF